MMGNVAVERFSLISSKPFEQVLTAFEAALAHPNVAGLFASIHSTRSVPKWKARLEWPLA